MQSVLIAAAYLLVFIGLDLITKRFQGLPGIVAWYPPAGITYALLLVFGVTFAPAVTIALVVSSIFIYRMPQPIYLLVLWALILTIIYAGTATFLRRIIRFDWQLRKLRDVTWFVLTAVIVSAILAVLSVSSSAGGSNIPRSELLRSIFDWWIGETVGVLTVTPFLLIFVMPGLKRFMGGQPLRQPGRRSFPRPSLATFGQVFSIALTLYWVFGAPVLDEFHPLYLIALPLIWVALQRGFKGVSVALLVMNSGVVLSLWLFRSNLSQLGGLELLMIVNCIVGLLMGAVVTERKQAEAALRESGEQYRTLVEQASDGIFITDGEGRFIEVNSAGCSLVGYSRDEILQKTIRDLTKGAPTQPLLLDELRGGKKLLNERELIRKDGTLVAVEISAKQFPDGRLQGIVRDITERKRANEEIVSLAKYPSENPNPVLRLSRDGVVLNFNSASKGLMEMWGCPLGGVAPQYWRDLTTQTLLSGKNETIEIECNGKVYSMFVTPVSEQGYVNIYGSDITVSKRAEIERQAQLAIMQGMAETENLDGLLELVRKSLAKVISAENFFVVFHNNSSGLFEEVFALDKFDPPMPPSKLEKSIISYVFRTGEPLLLTQAKFEELVSRGEVELVGTKPAIWMGAPLKTPTGTIGVLAVQDYKDPNCYSERDKEFLSSVSAQVAAAIERKWASDKLEEERILLRTLIDNLPDRIYVMDTQGRKTVSNMADWKAAGGEKMEDVLGKTDLETYPLELAKDYWAMDKSVIESGKAIFNREEPGLDSEGKPAWLLSSNVPLRDGQGKVTGLVGIGRDITERKLAEETLQKSEKRFRALVNNSLEEISLIAPDGTLIWESPTSRRPLGYKPGTFEGHSLMELLHPDEQAAATRLLGDVMKTPGSIQEAVFRLRHRDGSWRWMEAVLNNLLDEPAVKAIVINYRDITERKQKEEEIVSRTEELTRLYQLSRELADADEVENVIDIVNRHAVESVHTTFASIALLEDDTLVLRGVHPVRNINHNFIPGTRQPIAALPICQRVLDKNEPVILKKGDPEVGEAERGILMLDFAQSVCLVPLHLGVSLQHLDQTIGILILGEARAEKREPFTPEKIRLARSIGDQAAAAIRRLMLREQAGLRLQHLASLSEIDRAIASTFDLRVSLQIILKHVIEQLKVDAADVLVLNPHTQVLEYAAGSGFHSPEVERIRQPRSEGQAGRALVERKLIKITDVAASGAAFSHPELIKAEQAAAYFAMPLITKGQVMGVMEIMHRTPLDPDEEWLDFFRTLAGQAAIAIDNVHMFESLQQTTDELELAYDATIEGWSHALDLRDKETEGHTQRVTGMTVELARSFGLSEADLVNVRWGALLHDIGKMGVPDGILLKPGALTDEEWVVMKRHPTLAYEMLSPIRYLHRALDIPYCHHEWWDGSGYPHGLKGEEIPLAARIFAVVDVWDALVSDRPYRKAWSMEKARDHIQTGSGTHFDPQVVIKFLTGHGYQDSLH